MNQEIYKKLCSTCKESKSADCFSKDSSSDDGLQLKCKSCYSAYRIANREKILARQSKWYFENRENISDKGIQNYKLNPSKNRQKSLIYYYKIKQDPEAYSRFLARSNENVKRSQKLHPEHQSARWAVQRAVRSGQIIRPSICSECGFDGKIEAHHDSYLPEFHLKVRWLCRKCHAAHHRKYPDAI